MKHRRYAKAIALALLVLALLIVGIGWTSRVSTVQCLAIDGDTLNCQGEHVRILGVNAPEAHCLPEGPRATQYLRNFASAGPLKIERMGRDRYGRTLARVWSEDISVAEMIVASGNGVRYGSFDRVTPGRDLPRRPDHC